MRRLLLACSTAGLLTLSAGCNTADGEDTDGASGDGTATTGASTGVGTTSGATDTATAGSASASASASGSTSDGTTTSAGTISGTGDGSSGSDGSSGDSGSTGSTGGSSESTAGDETGTDPQALCEATGGTWDPVACGDYVCGVPNPCEAIIPGCDCGPDANFVDGEGCVDDPKCEQALFSCAGEVDCVLGSEYCEIFLPGLKGAPITYTCMDIPVACDDMQTCDCLETELMFGLAGACNVPPTGGLVVQMFGA
ncbi:MAG: hypothetical protein AAGA54_16000 [Myxococcota bacterium]